MHGLGELEAAVMNILWDEQPLKVRDVLDRLETGKRLAYTTVMTVLDNLHRKGFVKRERIGRAWHYRPAQSREAHVGGLINDALATGGDRTAALLHFVEQLPSEEAAQLRALLDRSPD